MHFKVESGKVWPDSKGKFLSKGSSCSGGRSAREVYRVLGYGKGTGSQTCVSTSEMACNLGQMTSISVSVSCMGR